MTRIRGGALGVVRRLAALTLLAVLGVAVLSGCLPEEEQVPGVLPADPKSALGLPALQGIEPMVKDETRVLDPAEAEAITTVEILNPDACANVVGREPCEFRITFPALPDGVAVGNVLVSDVAPAAPAGFLVIVDAIDGGVVSAHEGTLGDALEQGEFLVEEEFGPDDIAAITPAPGVTLLPGEPASAGGTAERPSTSVESQRLAFAHGFSAELEPGLTASGNVSLDVGCGVYGGLTWETFLDVPIYPNGVYFDARCGIDESAWIEFVGATALTLDKQYELYSLDLDAITVFIGPVPLVFIPTVTIYATVSGELQAAMNVRADQYFKAQAGIRYADGFSLIKEFGSDFTYTVTGSGRLTVEAGVSAGESLMLYGLVGPEAIETASLRLTGKPPGEKPVWCLDGVLKGTVELDVDLGIKRLTWGPGELFNWSTELGCAENQKPTVTITDPAPGGVLYPGNQSLGAGFRANAFDLEDGELLIHWTSSRDGDLGTSKTAQVMPVPDLSLGTHTITATATDEDGVATSATVTIEVRDGSPSAGFQVKNSNGDWVATTSVSGAKGEFVDIRVTPSSPIPLTVPSCTGVSWQGPLSVTPVANCDFRIALGTVGSHTLTATVTDPNGTGSASLGVTVSNPPAVATPQFTGITASSGGYQLFDGQALEAGQQVQLMTQFLNPAASGVTPTYVWSVRTNNGAWSTLTGPDNAPLTGSIRMFTSSSEYKVSHTYDFRVQISNPANGQLITTKTFRLRYQGAPT